LRRTIKYYSTNHKVIPVSFREALLTGLAQDGGLYIPDYLPVLTSYELESLSDKNYSNLASEILGRIIGNEISKDDLQEICNEIYTFPVPLENIYDKIWIMRLDQGPTASFKDFAALLMGRLIQYYLNIVGKEIIILTATSGDTGSAVANAFRGLKNIKVIILFPSEEITELQRKQMTTLNENINVISVNGKFDDCQKLVKRAFMDPDLSRFNLSSANSINIGRLLPQSVYYFYAWAKLSGKVGKKAVFSVPSGNFGNLAGGIIAHRMGLPVHRFIIATNENDEVPTYLKTGNYVPLSPSKNCISSAMNVGHPSNLARIVSFYEGIMDEKGTVLKTPDLKRMQEELFSISIDDKTTKLTMKSFYSDHHILIEPHGAVAWKGLMEYLRRESDNSKSSNVLVSLETAHPAKFSREIKDLLLLEPQLPASLYKIQSGNEEFISLENNYDLFKKYINKNF
jgi:threonine synthase